MRKKEKVNPKALFWTFAVLAAFGILCTAFYIRAFTYPKIYPGVSVCGVSLGNVTKAEAEEILKTELSDTVYSGSIRVKYGSEVRTIDLADKYTLDIAQTAQDAYNAGRGKNLFSRLFLSLTNMTKKFDIPLALTENGDTLDAELTEAALEIEEGHSFFQPSEDYTSIAVDLAKKNAFILDIDATKQAILENVSHGKFDPVEFSGKRTLTPADAELIYSRIQSPAVNASIEIVHNEVVIKPHRVGILVNKDLLLSHLKNKEMQFTLPVTAVMPRLTTDHFSVNMFADILGEYKSPYDESNADRTQNVVLTASLINGVIIAPGKTFSFNEVVGERNTKRGFKRPQEYSGGGEDDGVGGGISQVSSTLYCVQLFADLETVSRKNHEFAVNYVPEGMDANSIYGSVDYSFKNTTDYPIKIEAITRDGELIVRILGTKEDKSREINIINQVVETKPYTTVEQQTNTLPEGATMVKQYGAEGKKVDTYKVYIKDGIEEYREFVHSSVYKPVNQIILFGGRDSTAADVFGTPEPTQQPATPEPPAETQQPESEE